MRYVKYTLVDTATKKPLTVEPARAGTEPPYGVVEIFFDSSSFHTGVPWFYGSMDDSMPLQDGIEEISEEDLINHYRTELTRRSNARRLSEEASGVEHNGIFISTSIENQNRISFMVTGLLINKEIDTVDFLENDEWYEFGRNEILDIGIKITSHIFKWESWGSMMAKRIKDAKTIEDLNDVKECLTSKIRTD